MILLILSFRIPHFLLDKNREWHSLDFSIIVHYSKLHLFFYPTFLFTFQFLILSCSAVLDECTNGVAPDVEVELYQRCQELGITVFSISHKLELKTLHDYELHYLSDGQGGYTFGAIDHERDSFRVSQSGEFIVNVNSAERVLEGAGIDNE